MWELYWKTQSKCNQETHFKSELKKTKITKWLERVERYLTCESHNIILISLNPNSCLILLLLLLWWLMWIFWKPSNCQWRLLSLMNVCLIQTGRVLRWGPHSLSVGTYFIWAGWSASGRADPHKFTDCVFTSLQLIIRLISFALNLAIIDFRAAVRTAFAQLKVCVCVCVRACCRSVK